MKIIRMHGYIPIPVDIDVYQLAPNVDDIAKVLTDKVIFNANIE